MKLTMQGLNPIILLFNRQGLSPPPEKYDKSAPPPHNHVYYITANTTLNQSYVLGSPVTQNNASSGETHQFYKYCWIMLLVSGLLRTVDLLSQS